MAIGESQKWDSHIILYAILQRSKDKVFNFSDIEKALI
jgi:hypothetical protein